MMTGFFSSPHTLTILGIIFGFGTLAGLASNYLDAAAGKPTRHQNLRGVLLGILAAATVPLLLQMLSSDLLADAIAEPHKYLVFGGYCVITALFADRFLRGLGDNLLKKLSDLETKVEAARENADAALENSSVSTEAENPETAPENVDTGIESAEEIVEEEESENESFNPNKIETRKPAGKPRSVAPAPVAPARAPRDRVMDALRDRRQKTKTADAIALLAKVSASDATSVLLDMESSGSAKKLKTSDGKVFWKAV